MEIQCRWCSRTDICDHVDDWYMDEDGISPRAKNIESCPDFKMNMDCLADLLKVCVKSMDTDTYAQVVVDITDQNMDIVILTNRNLAQDEMLERVKDLQVDLQELNDTMIHMGNAEFNLSFMYMSESDPGVPSYLGEDGSLLGDSDLEEIDPDMPSDCPICGCIMENGICGSCGYESEPDDWSESLDE